MGLGALSPKPVILPLACGWGLVMMWQRSGVMGRVCSCIPWVGGDVAGLAVVASSLGSCHRIGISKISHPE
jgi:hypothetical protein